VLLPLAPSCLSVTVRPTRTIDVLCACFVSVVFMFGGASVVGVVLRCPGCFNPS
jgi:hypothetical protein